jgi:hypothetical protein
VVACAVGGRAGSGAPGVIATTVTGTVGATAIVVGVRSAAPDGVRVGAADVARPGIGVAVDGPLSLEPHAASAHAAATASAARSALVMRRGRNGVSFVVRTIRLRLRGSRRIL